jgi:GAF domain-containing protein
MSLPNAISGVLARDIEPELLFTELMPAVGEILGCDRCFLYLRDPTALVGRVPFCWVRSANIPVIHDPEWKQEPVHLTRDDPMFAAAVHTKPSIFIEDVETADRNVVNSAFERTTFGHRALIHAHVCHNHQLWGVLQPCIFDQPRVWTVGERQVINQLVNILAPAAVAYVRSRATVPYP